MPLLIASFGVGQSMNELGRRLDLPFFSGLTRMNEKHSANVGLVDGCTGTTKMAIWHKLMGE
jgi:hypothetical protein